MPVQHPDPGPTPHEDLERKPDGVPHDVVGLVALFSWFASLAAAFFLVATGRVVAVVVSLAVTIFIIVRLYRRAERNRDHVHPSL